MNSLNGWLSSMGTSARAGLALGAGLIVLLTAVALWWVLSPREQLLFGNLRETDAAEIVHSLNEWKVPHSIVHGGSGILVPEGLVYQTRMRLVSAGVPRGGHVGFELFDDSDFGVTEFAQRVNYQRALTGEIERTIAALPGVENARVHLTIRRPGLFVGKDESSKASVALTLVPGETLERRQLSGIRSLVAAAVEGLAVEAVSVVGSDGALLAGSGSPHAGIGLEGRAQDERQLEQELQQRLAQLLGQYFSREEFEVSVDATLNFDTIQEVNERPLMASGSSRQEVSRAPGRVERLSVAVVLPPSLDALDVARLRSLIEAAAGVDESRGDRLEVMRFGRGSAFIEAAAAASQEAPESVTRAGEAVPRSPAPTGQLLPRWLLAASLVVLIGGIVIVALQRRPQRLDPQEREAVLARMRSWLAEGSHEP